MKKIFAAILAFILTSSISLTAFATTFTIDFGGNYTLLIEAATRADLAKSAFEISNQMRVEEGLEPMIWDDSLARPAMQRAAEASVSDDDYNSQHKRPNGMLWSTVASDAKAETIVYGMFATPQSVVNEWMSGAEYSDNILNPDFTSVAIGCVETGPDEFYWIQLFGDKINPNPPEYYIVTFDDSYGSEISCQMIPDGGKVMKPIDPFSSGYIAEGWFKDDTFSIPWNFDVDTVDSNITLYMKWVFIGYDYSTDYIDIDDDIEFGSGKGSSSGGISGSIGGSRSSGGGGGGSGGSGGSVITSSASSNANPGMSSNVNRNGSVNNAIICSEANKALARGENEASIRTKNAVSVSPSILKALADAAAKAGKTLILYADTTSADGKTVQGRLYVESAKLTGLTGVLKLGVFTDSQKTSSAKSMFEKWFNNTVTVIHCAQQGSFGAKLQIAAKADLSKLDTKTLKFYSYDKETNSYVKIINPDYSIDSNGYIHFYTDKGGDIIIIDKPFMKHAPVA